MANKKTTAKKTTAKRIAKKAAPKEEPIAVGHKSCAYPSCSARGTQTFGANDVPSCDAHAYVFETQANDGAGIQQLMATYEG